MRARLLAGGPIEDLGGALVGPSSFAVLDAQLYVGQHALGQDILQVPVDGGVSAAFEPLVDYAGDLAIVGTDLYRS